MSRLFHFLLPSEGGFLVKKVRLIGRASLPAHGVLSLQVHVPLCGVIQEVAVGDSPEHPLVLPVRAVGGVRGSARGQAVGQVRFHFRPPSAVVRTVAGALLGGEGEVKSLRRLF